MNHPTEKPSYYWSLTSLCPNWTIIFKVIQYIFKNLFANLQPTTNLFWLTNQNSPVMVYVGEQNPRVIWGLIWKDSANQNLINGGEMNFLLIF